MLRLQIYIRAIIYRQCILDEVRVTRVLAEDDISISSVVQKEVHDDSVPVVIITHESNEGAVQRALEKIRKLDIVVQDPIMIRIEDI